MPQCKLTSFMEWTSWYKDALLIAKKRSIPDSWKKNKSADNILGQFKAHLNCHSKPLWMMPSTSLCRTFTLTWVILWLSLNCLLHNLLFLPVVWITSVMCSLICFCQLLIPVTQQNTNYLICFFLFPEFLDPSLKMYTNNLHNTRYITEKIKRIKQRRLFIHPCPTWLHPLWHLLQLPRHLSKFWSQVLPHQNCWEKMSATSSASLSLVLQTD